MAEEKRVREGGQNKKKRTLTKDLCQDRAVPRVHMPHNASARSPVTAPLSASLLSYPFSSRLSLFLGGFN